MPDGSVLSAEVGRLLPAGLDLEEQGSRALGYAGIGGSIIGMRTFGSSAPLKDLLTKFGFTPEKVLEAALHQLEKNKVP